VDIRVVTIAEFGCGMNHCKSAVQTVRILLRYKDREGQATSKERHEAVVEVKRGVGLLVEGGREKNEKHKANWFIK
jgi:hypothetical protein